MSHNILLHNLQSTYVICNPFYFYYVFSFIHINRKKKKHIPAVHSWLPLLWPYRRPQWEKCWERYDPEQEHPSHLYDPELPADEPFIYIKIRECKEIINKLTSRDNFSCPQTFIPVMKLIFFSNLFQYDSFGSLSTNQKAKIWMLST